MSPVPSAETGLLLDGAGYGVPGKVLLSGLSAHLTEARIGIVGRNGSGKTTLLRLLAGLVAPTAGRVRVEGVDPFADRAGALSRVGILFQNPDHQILFPVVEEELAFGLRQQGMAPGEALARAREVLAEWGRGHWAGAAVSTLSQGQRQTLCLMAVLAMAPGTLLLDEPYASLDLPGRMRLARLLEGMGQRVVVISHDPGALAGMERVIWLEDGRIRRDGTADAVLEEFGAEMARRGAADADTDIAG